MTVLTAPSKEARQTRKRDSVNGTGFWRTMFIGSDAGVQGVASIPGDAAPESVALFPVAFLIELDANAVLGTHFHRANQFQIFVAGDGKLGRHVLGRVFVHYADAYSGYGPIRAGNNGLHFFTLRDAWDPGARFLPDGMAELRAGRRGKPRQAYAGPIAVGAADSASEPRQAAQVEVLTPAEDGLAAWLYRLPPGEQVVGRDPGTGGGQYWLVLSGSMASAAGRRLSPPSCAFVTSDEPSFIAEAGHAGCEALCLQFPRRALERR